MLQGQTRAGFTQPFTCECRDYEGRGRGEEEGARAHQVGAHRVHGARGEVDEPGQVAGVARGRRRRRRGRRRPGARFNRIKVVAGNILLTSKLQNLVPFPFDV